MKGDIADEPLKTINALTANINIKIGINQSTFLLNINFNKFITSFIFSPNKDFLNLF